MQFLGNCDVERCRHYHGRHAELEAMGGVDKPLRIQLYDHLPELSSGQRPARLLPHPPD